MGGLARRLERPHRPRTRSSPPLIVGVEDDTPRPRLGYADVVALAGDRRPVEDAGDERIGRRAAAHEGEHAVFGVAAVEAGHRVRYFTAAELVETLYRALADNSVGRVIDTLLRNELIIIDELGFAPLDDTGAQLLFRFIAAAYERRALGIASHWPFESWGRFLPEHTTAVSLLDRLLHHAHVIVTDGESYRMREARTRRPPRGGTRTT